MPKPIDKIPIDKTISKAKKSRQTGRTHKPSKQKKSPSQEKYIETNKKFAVQLLQEQMHNITRTHNFHLQDTLANAKFKLYNIVQQHLREILINEMDTTDGHTSAVISQLQNCFIAYDKENVIHKNKNKIVLTDNKLGHGTYSQVSILEGFQNSISIYKIACKLMLYYKFNINELLYYLLLKQELLVSFNPHYPLMYAYLYCDNKDLNTDLPLIISSTKTPYFMLLTELADGTLLDIIKSDISNEMYLPRLYNAIEQIILSLCFFNKLGHLHSDTTNSANFLYKKIELKNNYFRYEVVINNISTKIIVKNMGFLWILSDFGNSTPILQSATIPITDIVGFLDGIMFYSKNKYKNHDKIHELEKYINVIKNIINSSNNSLQQFMQTILKLQFSDTVFTIDYDLYDYINETVYVLNFDIINFVALPLFGYIPLQ